MLNFDKIYRGTFYRSYNWAKYLVSAGHSVTILCVSNMYKLKPRIHNEVGIKIIETPTLLNGNKFLLRLSGTWGWGILDIFYRLKELIFGNYDIIHTFEHFPNVSLPIYLAPQKKVPILISDWCDHYGKGGFREYEYSPYKLYSIYKRVGSPLRWLMDYLEKDIRRRANSVTVISKYLYNRAVNMGLNHQKIFLIPGSVDVKNFKLIPKHLAKKRININSETNIISFLGSAQFDVDFAINAFSLLLKKRPNSHFLIIGTKNSVIENKAKKLNIVEKITQTGWCSNDLLSNYLSASDVFLLPMRKNDVNEARWPNKIGEYMASGRPTICTKVGDVADLILKEQIGLVSEVDFYDFSEKILKILSDEKLAFNMGRRARKVAENFYSLEIQGEILLNIYKSLLPKQILN